MAQQTVIQYVLSRLRQLGVTDVFGVPGDYAFPVTDAICNDKNMNFIGSCNEINAAYCNGTAPSSTTPSATARSISFMR